MLGFDLGVEAMQLAILVATVPWLLLLARHHRAYAATRLTIAGFAAIAALAWILDRTALIASPVPRLVERIAGSASWLLVALATLAITLELAHRVRGPRPRPRPMGLR